MFQIKNINVNFTKIYFIVLIYNVESPTARAILAGFEKSSFTDLANIANKVILNLFNNPVSHIDSSVIYLIASLQLKVVTQRQSRSPSLLQSYVDRHRSKNHLRVSYAHVGRFLSSLVSLGLFQV